MRGERWNIQKPDEKPWDETRNQLTSHLTQRLPKTPEAMGISWTAEFLQPSKKSPLKSKKSSLKSKKSPLKSDSSGKAVFQ